MSPRLARRRGYGCHGVLECIPGGEICQECCHDYAWICQPIVRSSFSPAYGNTLRDPLAVCPDSRHCPALARQRCAEGLFRQSLGFALLGEVLGRRKLGFVTEREGTEVNAHAGAGMKDLMCGYCLLRIHVARHHEPAWLISPDGQSREAHGTETVVNPLEVPAPCGIAGEVDRAAGGFKYKTAP